MAKKNNKNFRTYMKDEAIKRLELIGVDQSIINDFREFNIINKSDYGRCVNHIFDGEKNFITEIEKKKIALYITL